MFSYRVGRAACRGVFAAVLLALFPIVAAAQDGRIAGTVFDEQRAPIVGAQVEVTGTVLSTVTDADGRFALDGVPVGTVEIRTAQAGYLQEVTEVPVQAGQTSEVSVVLQGVPITLDEIVVSAGRRAQRVTEAPATIVRIDASELELSVGNSFVGALKQVQGLDYAQVGITSVAINARGFNSSFNNRMLMLEDGRIAVLPENGLPVGTLTPVSKIDLASMEVIIGPGAALYGADASNGVFSLTTKDPRDYPGTTVEVTGGNREYFNFQGRQAGTFGNWGYKVTGEYQTAHDWENRIQADPRVATSPLEITPGDTTGLDWQNEVLRGYGALVYYRGDSQFEINAGASQSNAVGQTNVGRNQLVDWTYNVLQAKATLPNWYFSAYRTQSNAGDTYAANRYTTTRLNPNNTALSDVEVREISDWPGGGELYAAEAQNNFRLPSLLNTTIVSGVQFRRDVVRSDEEWLTDRLTGEDLEINQLGVYAQAESDLSDQFQLILAGRYDTHDNYDSQFSPKVGLIFKPVEGQAFRATYNRAFKSPSTLQTNFFIPNFVPFVGVFGNREGFTVQRADGSIAREYQPLVPEENQTYELGYKGILRNRLFVDIAGYYSRYENFLSPLSVIANPLVPGAATIAFDAQGDPVVDEQGGPQVVLTYFNLGEATIYGTDIGVNYVVTPRIDLVGTYSYVKLDELEGVDTNVPGEVEATSLNSPSNKWTLGANFRDFGNLLGAATLRRVQDYYFRSGVNFGQIPGFTTLDLNFGYKLPRFNSQINLGVSNLFACGGQYAYAGLDANNQPIDRFRQNPISEERECGFGVKHQELINMPEIGTMVFLGVRFQTR